MRVLLPTITHDGREHRLTVPLTLAIVGAPQWSDAGLHVTLECAEVGWREVVCLDVVSGEELTAGTVARTAAERLGSLFSSPLDSPVRSRLRKRVERLPIVDHPFGWDSVEW